MPPAEWLPMAKSCKMSVVIPCYNHGEFLPEAVGSVTNLDRDDTELIVVDDGSTDERTRKEMNALCAQGIKVIRQENKGLAAARNAGITASLGDYVLPLDADNRLRPDWITRGIGILDSQAEIGVVYGDAQCFGTCTNRWTVGPFDPERLVFSNFIDATALYRRAVWEQNKGYDGTMPVQGFEDWDFWLGALEHGWRFAYLPEVFFDYRRSEQSMITHALAFREQVREFVARKHPALYVRALASIMNEHESVSWTLRNLGRLLKWRLAHGVRNLLSRSDTS